MNSCVVGGSSKLEGGAGPTLVSTCSGSRDSKQVLSDYKTPQPGFLFI